MYFRPPYAHSSTSPYFICAVVLMLVALLGLFGSAKSMLIEDSYVCSA